MKVRMIMAAVAGLLLAGMATAQCPHTQTRTVPASFVVHAGTDCAGVDFSFQGVQLVTGMKGCPLLATYTPQHEISVPSGTETKTRVLRTVPVYVVSFRCKTDYFLFIPVGSSCVLDRMKPAGVEERLETAPC